MTLQMSQIKEYLEKEGPKTVVNQNFSLVFALARLVGRSPPNQFNTTHRQDPVERIYEITPGSGTIYLSDEETTVLTFNHTMQRLEQAVFNIESGQPEPDMAHPMLDEIVPSSAISVEYFHGRQPQSNLYGWHEGKRRKQAAGFVDRIIKLSKDVPVLEVGLNTGDSFNRYFPARGYRFARVQP
ncbi:hypothetical protein ACFL0V_06745 [Nanoarchaeota archaeon]